MRLGPARRVDGFGTSIFSEMSRLAAQHGAVNLGQGFPDFPAPAFVKEAAARHINEDRNQYAVSWGVPRLRKAIAENWARRHGREPDPENEVTVAGGATEVLFDALISLVDPGDEVVVFEPFYDAYVPDILMAGGVPRFVTLRPPRWELDPDELRSAFGPRTRAVIVNTPHNPTGKVHSTAELELVAQLCVEHGVIAITDEVYAEIVFDSARHVSLATLPGMWERTITIESMGKTFSVTGWKVGWAIAPPPLTRAVRSAHQFVTFTNGTPFQEALADALAEAPRLGYYDSLRAEYACRRDRLASALGAVGLPCLPVSGSYFLMADITGTGFTDDTSFCRHLITEVGVAAIPPSFFYGDPARAPLLARFCFAKRDETLDAAGQRLGGLAKRGRTT